MSTVRTVRVDPAFSAALRAELTAQVAATPARRRRRAWSIAGALAGIGVAGGGIAIAADLLPLPGADVVTPLAASVSEVHTGTATVDLGAAPAGVTHVDVQLWCLSTGTFTFPDGASMTCATADYLESSPAGHTLAVADGGTSVTITADDDARWRLQATYVTRDTTPWEVNANGDTYGIVNEQGQPDLVAAVATNGSTGYVYATDLAEPELPSSPEEAATWSPASRTIPVYESDGETVIGEFVIGGP